MMPFNIFQEINLCQFNTLLIFIHIRQSFFFAIVLLYLSEREPNDGTTTDTQHARWLLIKMAGGKYPASSIT